MLNLVYYYIADMAALESSSFHPKKPSRAAVEVCCFLGLT
jgi:hypothetical protein